MIVDYWITKSQDVSYKLQGATKNAISGISPLSNRKMFMSYHQPTFLYGTETMPLNLGDIERLEIKYRKTLKCMLSVPDCTPSVGQSTLTSKHKKFFLSRKEDKLLFQRK